MATETYGGKITRLLKDLRDATAQGRLTWEDTAEESMFRVVFNHGMIRIGEVFDHKSGLNNFVVFLLDRDARVVEEITITEGPDYLVLQEIFDMARRSAMGAENILDQILAEVEQMPKSPGRPTKRPDETVPGGRYIQKARRGPDGRLYGGEVVNAHGEVLKRFRDDEVNTG